MRGVVLRLVHMQRDDIIARVDRRLLRPLPFVGMCLSCIVADGHVARVGEIMFRFSVAFVKSVAAPVYGMEL